MNLRNLDKEASAAVLGGMLAVVDELCWGEIRPVLVSMEV
jgi:hypothetical protein